MSKGRNFVNEGIQARNIRAGVLAVGKGAKAVGRQVHMRSRSEHMSQAIADLRRRVEGLELDVASRIAVEQDLEELEQTTERGSPQEVGQILDRISGTLGKVGALADQTLSLRKPIETIASLVGATLSLVRLW